MLDKTLVIIGGTIVVAGLAIVSSLPYILDFLGEILIVCGLPLIVGVTVWGIHKMIITMAQARLSNEEHAIHMRRLEIQNHRMMLDTQMVDPSMVLRTDVGGIRYVESVFNERLARIDANRNHAPVPQTITYSPHVSYRNDVKGVEAQDVPQVAEQNTSNEFRKDMLSNTEVFMGFNEDGPHYMSPFDIKSVVCGGKSGMGKSNTTRFLLMQYARLGWKIAIFDPHGDSKQGILPSLMPLRDNFYIQPAIEFEDGMEMVKCIIAEGLRRKEVKNSSPEDFQPILLVIDEVAEVAALSADEDREYLEKHLPIILRSFRKYNIYGMFISQFWSQSDMGRMGFLLRRAAQTSIIHQMAPDSAKVIEEFADHREIDGLPKGTCMFNNSEIKRMKLAIPLCEPHHIEEVLGTSGSGSKPTSDIERKYQLESKDIDMMEVLPEVLPEVDEEVPDEHLIYMGASALLKTSQRMAIEDALRRGDSNGQIISDVFQYKNKTSGRKGQQYARMINGVRLSLGLELPYSPARKVNN